MLFLAYRDHEFWSWTIMASDSFVNPRTMFCPSLLGRFIYFVPQSIHLRSIHFLCAQLLRALVSHNSSPP